MDGSKTNKSDAAATRKRRSSILKSQRNVRAPLSELEFNVTTPDQAKSRRVSFSRRTGVAEFEISEATTAWKNVYEEHNKSLESSANESGVKAAPRRVSHLGGRASHFEDESADVFDDNEPSPPPPPTAQLDPTTTINTLQFCHMDAPGLHEATDNLDVHFSAVAPLGLPDDLDLLRQDLDMAPKRDNINEISIDVDFNATHFSLKVDDDDMSITDTIRSPAVATEKSQVDFSVAATKMSQDWTADKENIVINPYVAPPPAEFPCEDDILVFDGKKCKFQSKVDLKDQVLPVQDENIPPKTMYLDDMTETRAIPVQILQNMSQVNPQRTVVFGDGDISITQAVPSNIIAPKIIEDKENQKTLYFNDLADMSVTQALPADIIQNEPQHSRTIVYDDGHISMTQAVPARVLLTGHRNEIGLANKLEETKRKTIVNDNEHVSNTGVVPRNLWATVNRASNTDRGKTIVYGNDDNNVSMTGVVLANIIDEVKTEQPTTDRRKTIVYGNDDNNVSITGVVPANIIDEVKTEQPTTDRRKTIVYGNDDNNVSMTGVVPANIIDEVKTEQPTTDKTKTIVYGNDDGNVSVTGVVPANIIDEVKTEQPKDRRTIVYGNYDNNVSMTGVVPAYIIDEVKTEQPKDRRTIVYDNDEYSVSMSRVLPSNIIDADKLKERDTNRRQTVVFGNDNCDLSITGVAPANILEAQQPHNGRRKTIDYGKDDGNISMTGVVAVNILEAKDQQPSIGRNKTINEDGNILEAKVDQQPNSDRRKTVVFENNDGELSITGVAPVNILEAKAEQPNIDRRKTIVYGNDDGNVSMTGVVSADIREAKVEQQPNIDRRRTVVFEKEDGDLSMTGVAPVNILEAKGQQPNIDRRKTIVYGNDEGNVSMTGVVTANIIDQATSRHKTNIEQIKHLSSTGLALVNILDGVKDQEPNSDRRKTVVYGNDDNNISITGVVPAKILDEAKAIDRRTVVYGADDGNMYTTKVLLSNILNHDGNAQPINVEPRKTIVCNNDNELSMTATVNTVDETKQNKGHKSIVCENNDSEQQKQLNGDIRKTVVFSDDDGNMSVTGIVPENILEVKANQPFNEDRRRTIVYENEDGNVSMTRVLPANIIDRVKTDQARDRRTIVYDNDEYSVSMTRVVPSNIAAEKIKEQDTNKQPNQSAIGILLANMLDKEYDVDVTHPNTDTKTVVDENVLVSADLQNKVAKLTVYEENDVSMSELPAQITPDDSNVAVQETLKSVVCENNKTRDNLLENFEEKNDQTEMIEAIKIPILVESDEDGDVFMEAVSRPTTPNPHSTFNKPLVDQFDKSLAGQIGSTTFDKSDPTFNKSMATTDALANQTFDKSMDDPRSATINKSMAGQNRSAFEKSSNQECSTFNKSAGQPLSTALNKSLPGQDQATFNKTLADQPHSTSMNKSANEVLVYGAMDIKDKNMSLYMESLNREDIQSQKSLDNASLALSKSSVDHLLQSRPPRQSIESEPIPVKNSVLDTLLDMSHVSEEIPNECESKTSPPISNKTVTSDPTSESYILVKVDEEMKDSELQTEVNEPIAVYKEHGIVCRLQKKLSALKHVLHITEKPPKKDSIIHIIDNQELPLLLPKSSLRHSPISENNKSVKIDLTARISIDNIDLDDDIDNQDNHTRADLTSKIEEKYEPQVNLTKCQANDTRAILDSLSDFTDTRRSGEFEPVPSPDKPKRTSAPDRKSMVISREDMLREIAMAQALMKSEMQEDTELEPTECSSDEQESPHRISGEVVKTLRFEDDESILESKILQKPSFPSNSPRRHSAVIPAYEISDPVKELMKDLIKPLTDIDQPLFSKAESSQVDTLGSSQIDLVPSRPVLLSPHSYLQPTQEEIAPPETHVTVKNEPVIFFDQLNPLNNIFLPPIDEVEVHKYNPRMSEESLAPSVNSQCCQTESGSGKDVDVGMVLVNSKVDRPVAQDRSVMDCGVDTTEMKGSLPLHGILVNAIVDRSVAEEKLMKDAEANTSIVMKANHDLLAASSSLTLVDDALSHTTDVQIDVPTRSPVRVIFKLDEADSSVQLGSELTSESKSEVSSEVSSERRKRGQTPSKGAERNQNTRKYRELASDSKSEVSESRRKRGHIPSKGSELDEYSSAQLCSERSSDISSGFRRNKREHIPSKGAEVTPKPASKVLKVSNSAEARKRRSASPSEMDSSVSDNRESSVTVAPLYACARSDTSASATDGSRVCVWRPELLHEASSKNLISEQEPSVNVVAKIDVLPFMGTSECEWESRAADTWSFLLLRRRLRLLVRLEHRATNTARALVRADTPVRLVLVQHAMIEDHSDPVAALCLCLAADTLQRLSARGVARAGQVPALLRHCAAVVRVALRWGNVMRAARVALAFSLQDDALSLKVANIPLRSVWEITFRIELADKDGTPYPRATDLKVSRIVATWAPAPHELQDLLDPILEDWGHVPRTIWKIFKYLKNKKPEDELLTA